MWRNTSIGEGGPSPISWVVPRKASAGRSEARCWLEIRLTVGMTAVKRESLEVHISPAEDASLKAVHAVRLRPAAHIRHFGQDTLRLPLCVVNARCKVR